jgi:hypothetical protein
MAIQKITSPVVNDNIEFSGTEAVRMPNGTTGQRANAAAGDIRFNTTINLMEYYDGTNWKAIDASPVVTSVTGFINEDDTTNLVLAGSNFQPGATVEFFNFTTNTLIKAAPTVTRDSSAQLTVATGNDSSGMTAGTAISIKITNPSGLSATLDNALTVEADPTWVTSSGSLATIYDSLRSSYSAISVSATSSTGTVTYAVQSGSLPTGLSLNTSTGAITGTAGAVGSSTTSSFTLRATTDAQNVSFTDRNFSITVREPIITSFTSTGSGSFSVPSGISSVQVLVIAGGGGGADRHGGGGGAGGFVEHSTFPVTPGGSVSYTVGSGGPASSQDGSNGDNSVFGSITAVGGGGGRSDTNGFDGGSGAGGNQGPSGGGSGTQGPNGGGTGYGNPGGAGAAGPGSGGGGGGAGGSGSPAPSGSVGGAGGNGRSSSITGSPVFYAGGGGGGCRSSTTGGNGGPGGGGSASRSPNRGPSPASAGTTNTGGGGGAGAEIAGGGGAAAAGGPGVIIVRY